MIFRLIEKDLEEVEVDEAGETEWFDVGGVGGDSIAAVITVSEEDTAAGASVVLQGSLDKEVAVPIGSPTEISDDGNFPLIQDRPPYRYYRVAWVIDSGSFTLNGKILVKGDKAG